ncbi:uncharacterized protein LOC111657446 [Seriola lalandi dorsalis]|uniref:uncharacterized protein LOC111657446 n=1 Tax=Seriola lalandi dorsalis TaxID=1841481 RepID=UPI000C6F67E5|nr:uncharacterized protein LOC111657446 [Seriola lalandi dorsalis]
MTHPTDDFFCPQQKSSQGLHTQESGDAGFSSNMEHRFSDNYNENALPVADKGSFVIPIPKEELGVCEWPMGGEIVPQPPELEPTPCTNGNLLYMKAPRNPESPSVAGLVQEDNFPPQTRPIAVSENGLQEEAIDTLSRTATVTEGEPGLENCIMDAGGNPVKPKGPSSVPVGVRNGNHPRKRATGNNWKFCFFLALTCIPVSEGFPGAQPAGDQKYQRFICTDKDKCPELINIYGHDDALLYSRDPKAAFPGCSDDSLPALRNCSVCRDQDQIIIICPEDVGKLEVESSGGLMIENIFPVREEQQQQPNNHANTGLSPSCGLVLIVAAALGICNCF